MMFSTKAEYGIRVMVALARRAAAEVAPAGEPPLLDPVVPLAEIAEHDGLPLAYLEHLVARLRKAGLVDSRRGSRGGYMLARPAAQITMAEVVEALEGSIAPIECISLGPDGSVVCSRESDPSHPPHACPTKLLWTRVRFSIVNTLMQTTLADLVSGAGSTAEGEILAGAALAPPSTARDADLLAPAAVLDAARLAATPASKSAKPLTTGA